MVCGEGMNPPKVTLGMVAALGGHLEDSCEEVVSSVACRVGTLTPSAS